MRSGSDSSESRVGAGCWGAAEVVMSSPVVGGAGNLTRSTEPPGPSLGVVGGFGLARPLRHLAAAERTPAREHLGLANAEPELRRPVGPPGTADVAAHSDRGQLIGVGIELDQDAVGQPDAPVADLLGPVEQDLLRLLRGLGAGEVADADLARCRCRGG